MQIEALLPVAFLAGFFGSAHCFGMCGPLVVLLETAGAGRQNWTRRLLYNAGRATFYVALGAAAATLGLVLTRVAGIDTGLRLLRFIAAALVIAMGLNLLFNLRLLAVLETGGAALWQKLRPLTGRLLPVTSGAGAYAAGLLWGALPCGLVYSNVALAAATGNVASGALVMLTFWAGTLPALLVAGASAHRLAGWSRRPALRRAAGTLMIGIGVVALAMPLIMPFLRSPTNTGSVS